MGCMPKLRTEYQINLEATGRRYKRPRLRQIRVEPDNLTPVEWNNWWQKVAASVPR
jgi:hypothetical protein